MTLQRLAGFILLLPALGMYPGCRKEEPTSKGVLSQPADREDEAGILLSRMTPAQVRHHAVERAMRLVNEESWYFIYEAPDNSLWIRCVWVQQGAAQVITELFLSNTRDEHGAAAQEGVLRTWAALCPPMEPRFRDLFRTTVLTNSDSIPLRASDYVYSVCARNKAIVRNERLYDPARTGP